jgi:hypothetical protein
MEIRGMSAPSSEQEAQQIVAEIAAQPNLRAVTERMLVLIETLEPNSRRRLSLEILVGSLGINLRPTEDISDLERDEWLKVLES